MKSDQRRVAGAITALLTGLLFVVASGSSADANVYQHGWKTNQNVNLTGVYAYLAPTTSFHPDTNGCAIQSILIYNAEAARQLEVGLARCGSNGSIFDGSTQCNGGYAFIEAYVSGTYTCHQKFSFDNSDVIAAEVYRSSTTDTSFTGIIGSSSGSLGGYTAGTADQGYGWAEANYAASCSSWGPFHMYWSGFQKQLNVGSWVNGNDVRYNYNGVDCSSVNTLGGSSDSGDFDDQHS